MISNQRGSDRCTVYMVSFSVLGMMLELVAFPFQMSALLSIGVLMIRLAVYGAVFFVLVKEKLSVRTDFLKITLICVISLISAFASKGIGSPSLGVLVSFLELPLFLYVHKPVNRKKVVYYIYAIFTVLSLFYIALSFSPKAYEYYRDMTLIPYYSMTLGYSNPNQAAMYIFACFAVLTSAFFYYKSKIVRGFLLVDLCLLGRIIILTDSRAIMLVWLVGLLLLIPKRLPSAALRVGSFVIAVGFVPFSMLFRNFLESQLLFGISMETGRADLFTKVLSGLKGWQLIIGDYSYQFANLHNGFLSIVGTVGIVTALLLGFLLNHQLRRTEGNNHNRINRAVWLGATLFIAHSAAEGAMLTFGEVYAVLLGVLFFLASINYECLE